MEFGVPNSVAWNFSNRERIKNGFHWVSDGFGASLEVDCPGSNFDFTSKIIVYLKKDGTSETPEISPYFHVFSSFGDCPASRLPWIVNINFHGFPGLRQPVTGSSRVVESACFFSTINPNHQYLDAWLEFLSPGCLLKHVSTRLFWNYFFEP